MWAPQGKTIIHFITVVGYDDAKGIYYYTDTCGHSTDCGSLSDGGVHTVPQGQLWAAISAVPVNTSTAYNAGDGGDVGEIGGAATQPTTYSVWGLSQNAL